VDRARRRGSYLFSDITLIDIGLISTHSTAEGMVMRKSRTISGDDDGVRPFVTLHIEPGEADRNALVRYEIIDHNGQSQYVHEMKVYLRDGEMNILADHHLPLLNNERIGGAGGDWDLRVSVDGILAGVFSFAVTPSLTERDRRFSQADTRARQRLEDRPADDPVRLGELLRKPQDQQRDRR
jgi:hypothetical protein